MTTAANILSRRHYQRLAARNANLSLTRPASIETSVNVNVISIETAAKSHRHGTDTDCVECLPAEIDALVDNKHYRRKYRFMIKQGHLRSLLGLVAYVRSLQVKGLLTEAPSHLFAKMATNGRWEQTCKTLAKVARVERAAQAVAAKLGTQVTNFIYQQLWRGTNVERWADQARELPHDKPGQSLMKHFVWLCQQEARTA